VNNLVEGLKKKKRRENLLVAGKGGPRQKEDTSSEKVLKGGGKNRRGPKVYHSGRKEKKKKEVIVSSESQQSCSLPFGEGRPLTEQGAAAIREGKERQGKRGSCTTGEELPVSARGAKKRKPSIPSEPAGEKKRYLW